MEGVFLTPLANSVIKSISTVRSRILFGHSLPFLFNDTVLFVRDFSATSSKLHARV